MTKSINKTFQKEEVKIVSHGTGEKGQELSKISNSKELAELNKSISDYQKAHKEKMFKSNFTKFKDLFRKYARASQILKYKIGIFKELRQELDKDGEIRLVGVCDSNYDANRALRENKGDAVRLAIIKEDIDDGDTIQEYYDDGESEY